MSKRARTLEFAVLGLLHDAPMHGYELRKRLTGVLGWGRSLSYGSLYPCLKELLADRLIAEDTSADDDPAAALRSRRGRIVYKLTAEGKERFQELASDAGPNAWEDDTFGVHLAFFARTDRDVRMRILEGRRTRLEERREGVRSAIGRAREKVDAYTLELQRHGLESVDREVRWLTELISTERAGADAESRVASTTDTGRQGPDTTDSDGPINAAGTTTADDTEPAESSRS